MVTSSSSFETAPRWVSLADRLNPKRPGLFDPEFQTKWKQMSKAERRQVIQEDRQQIRQLKKRGKTQLPFEADPDDHCETSPTALKHIVPLLQLLGNRLATTASTAADIRIYDPYYCAGGTAKHLGALGFGQVYNKPEDFYQVIAENRQPPHDVLVTNPPYSGSHFDRLLEFLETQQQAPFMLLLPSHFAQRPAFQKFSRRDSCVYLTPPERYHYWTPEGRREQQQGETATKKRKHKNLHLGSRNSPFYSYWFVCLEPIISRKELLAMYSDGKLLEVTNQGCQLHRDPVKVSGANQAFHNTSIDSVDDDDKDTEVAAVVDERKKKKNKKRRRRETSDGVTTSTGKAKVQSQSIVLSDDDNPFLPPEAQPLD